MIDGKRVIAIIPARGGSKGIKNKNIIKICGKPLIQYSIDAARECLYIDKVLVSTDSPQISEIAQMCGADVPFLRPGILSGDYAKTIDVLLHAIDFLKTEGKQFDILVLLQPTSPLRKGSDIQEALEMYMEKGEKGVVSVSEVGISPVLLRTFENGQMLHVVQSESTVRRQDMKKCYAVNGAIYINKISELTVNTSLNDNPIGWILERQRAIDVDEKNDLQEIKRYLDKHKNN